MSYLQVVQQPIGKIHRLQSSLDAMKWNRGLSNSANPRLRYTSSRLLIEEFVAKVMRFFNTLNSLFEVSVQVEVDKKQLLGVRYE